MPMSYSIDKQRHLVLTRCWGVLSDADLLAHKAQLASDPDFHASMGQLSDVRAIERLAVTTEGVKLMVAHDTANADRVGGHRMALVVASDEVFGMARMYGQRSEAGAQGVGVFRSITDAKVWLAAGRSRASDSS